MIIYKEENILIPFLPNSIMEKEMNKDKLILFELLQDCRQPLSKIAKAVRLPQQTVSYRIAKMEKEKIIKKRCFYESSQLIICF